MDHEEITKWNQNPVAKGLIDLPTIDGGHCFHSVESLKIIELQKKSQPGMKNNLTLSTM